MASSVEPTSSCPAPPSPWRTAVAWIVTAAGALALWKGAAVLLLFFAGVLGALFLLCLATFLSRWTGGRVRIALTTVFVVFIAGLGFAVWAAAPALSEQAGQLREQLKASGEKIDEWIRDNAGNLPIDRVEDIGEQLAVENGVWSRVAGIFSTTVGAIGGAGLILVIAVFLAYDGDRYTGGLLRLVPPARRRRAAEVLAALNFTLTRWLLAQLCSMAFLGLSTWLVLWLLDVPLALLLATLTGLLTFVPYLGPFIAMIPIVLVAFVESPTLALYVAIAYLVVQNIESNLFMPLVYQKTVRMPPALTLGSQVLAGALFGLPGFMLATPLAAVVMVAVRMLYVQDVLGDDLRRPVVERRALGEPPAVI